VDRKPGALTARHDLAQRSMNRIRGSAGAQRFGCTVEQVAVEVESRVSPGRWSLLMDSDA